MHQENETTRTQIGTGKVYNPVYIKYDPKFEIRKTLPIFITDNTFRQVTGCKINLKI